MAANLLKRWILIGVCALLVLLQAGCSGLFFYPMSQMVRTPADINLEYEDVYFPSLDGTQLHGWFLPAEGNAKGTIIFYHGNAENISTHIGAVYWLPKAGYNVFLFDYRGYGLSQGETEINGVHQDGLAALRYVVKLPKVDPERLVVFGQSLGGAVAIYSTAHAGVPVKALVVESSFADYQAIFKEKLAGVFFTWPLQWPLSYTVTNQYSPLNHIQELGETPFLVVHGDADQIVPIHHGRQLFEAAKGDKQLWIVKGGHHTEAFTFKRDQYGPRLLEYLDEKLSTNP